MNVYLPQNLARALPCLVLLFLVPRIASACGCFPNSTVLDAYEGADLVVAAEMKTVVKGPNNYYGDISHVTMEVQKVFKGDVKTTEVLTFSQGDPVLGCSWQFAEDWVGGKFLLYLYRPDKPSEPYVISTCGRSRGLDGAPEDLLYLENIDRVKGRTRVSGVLEIEDEPAPGEQVRITGKNKTYIATTDKNGVYEIYDLPPGRYSLAPVLKPGWKVDEWLLTRELARADWRRIELKLPPPQKIWFTLRARKHFGAFIGLELANRIAGRVTTATGKPLKRVCVSLVSVEDPERSLVCNSLSDPDGSFEIGSVSAGSYRLIINHENLKSNYQPFPKLYYPGVTTQEEAKVLTVKFGESIEGLNFVVPKLDETVVLDGIVRFANGRPASKSDVHFYVPTTGDMEGSLEVRTGKDGRFSLTVLKGQRGELFSVYEPTRRDLLGCAALKNALGGKSYLETPRLQLEANENKTFELRLPASPCR